MSKKIRLGVVGTGGMANHQAGSFQEIPGVELTSCFDVDAGRARAFAEKHRLAHAASSLEELLGEVDAVTVVTPDRHHASPTIAALRCGKHVLCEKPLTVTLVEARRVAAAAKQAERRGSIHMINFSYRRSAAFQKAIELVAQGALGEVRHAHASYLQSWLSAPIWGGWTSPALLWRLQTAAGSGGVLGDLGCHILDMTTAIAGNVKRARCDLRTFPKSGPGGRRLTTYRGRKLDANDTAVLELEFDHGGVGVVQTTRWGSGHANSLRLEVHGTQGALLLDLDRDYDQIDLCLGKNLDRAAWRPRKLKPTPTNYERFVRAIRTGRRDQPDLLRGAQIQAYLDAAERSARSGNWESVRSWGA